MTNNEHNFSIQQKQKNTATVQGIAAFGGQGELRSAFCSSVVTFFAPIFTHRQELYPVKESTGLFVLLKSDHE